MDEPTQEYSVGDVCMYGVAYCKDDLPQGIFCAASQKAWMTKLKADGKWQLKAFRVKSGNTKDSAWGFTTGISHQHHH